MSDLQRIEQYLSQLISMVAKNNETLGELKSDVAVLKSDVAVLKSDMAEIRNQFEQEKEGNQARHEEILMEIRNQKYMINHHREKIAKNEEEISVIKQLMKS